MQESSDARLGTSLQSAVSSSARSALPELRPVAELPIPLRNYSYRS